MRRKASRWVALHRPGQPGVMRAAARGLAFEDAALEWMLRRCSRDLRSLTALFERLDHASLVAQRRLTVPFLRQVLAAD